MPLQLSRDQCRPAYCPYRRRGDTADQADRAGWALPSTGPLGIPSLPGLGYSASIVEKHTRCAVIEYAASLVIAIEAQLMFDFLITLETPAVGHRKCHPVDSGVPI